VTIAEFQVNGGPKAPSAARELLVEAIGTQVESDVVDRARLLVSEIVTNCVIHGGADEQDTIMIVTSVEADGVRTEVRHRGPHFVPPEDEPDLTSPGGLGLFLVEQMADAWGIDSGESVWFRLATPDRAVA
jgi:anti-sigma regulatory factor (Ser/Thr protein kinase)